MLIRCSLNNDLFTKQPVLDLFLFEVFVSTWTDVSDISFRTPWMFQLDSKKIWRGLLDMDRRGVMLASSPGLVL